MTIYIRFLAYWFAVVFCLLILGNILKNEYSNPNSNSNSNSTGSDVCCTETAMAEATLNTMSSVYKNGEQFRVFAQAVVAISVGVIFVAQGHSG